MFLGLNFHFFFPFLQLYRQINQCHGKKNVGQYFSIIKSQRFADFKVSDF